MTSRIKSNVISTSGFSNDITLNEYIKSNKNVPLSLFNSSSDEDALIQAIDYFKKEYIDGEIDVPSSSSYNGFKVRVRKNYFTSEIRDNFVCFDYMYPTTETKLRPLLKSRWEVGDIIYNTDITSEVAKDVIGWICIESGAPGKWKVLSYASNCKSYVESADSLPDANENNLGRILLLPNDTSLYVCNKEGIDYTWSRLTTMPSGSGIASTADIADLKVLTDENKFRSTSMQYSLNNSLRVLVIETFEDIKDVNETLEDGSKFILNLNKDTHIVSKKTSDDTWTVYSKEFNISSGNEKKFTSAWVYCDYIGEGSVLVYISRDAGVTFSELKNLEVSDIDSQPSEVSYVIKLKLEGLVTLKNIAWGLL